MQLTVPEVCGWSAGPHWPACGRPRLSQYERSQLKPSTVSPEGRGTRGISTHEEENSPCPTPVPPDPLPQGQAWSSAHPHLEAGTRSPQSLCSLHLPAVGTDRGSSALQGCWVPLGPGPVPPARALGADVGRCGGVERVGGQRKQHGRLGRSQERGPHQRRAGTPGCSLSGSRP